MLWLLPAAFAETPVLVSSLQARNPEAVGLAGLVEGFLANELDRHPELRVVRVEDTPDFDDYPARTYMDGCPPGDVVGCTLVVAQRGGARFAVTGSVQAVAAGSRVTIDVVDVEASRVVLSFTSELEPGSDETFAEGVAKVLVAAIGGELGEEDIRDDAEPEDDAATNEEVARQLAELSRELGAVTEIVDRPDRVIERPEYTVEDVAERMDAEGVKPWERVGMGPDEYVRYRNSGKSLREWRERAVGRRGQLVVRPYLAYAKGPYGGEYYGRYAIDLVQSEQMVVDALSAQAVQTGSGGGGGVQVAYGLLPFLDVGVAAGAVGGTYRISMDQEQVGTAAAAVPVEERGATTWFVGPRVTVAPFPQLPVRPALGGGLLLARGAAIGDYYDVDDALTAWPAPWLTIAEVFAGGEARVAKHVDLFVHVPVSVLVGGETAVAERVTPLGEPQLADYAPAVADTLGFGVHAGVQLRFGGSKPEASTRFDDVDALDDAP